MFDYLLPPMIRSTLSSLAFFTTTSLVITCYDLNCCSISLALILILLFYYSPLPTYSIHCASSFIVSTSTVAIGHAVHAFNWFDFYCFFKQSMLLLYHFYLATCPFYLYICLSILIECSVIKTQSEFGLTSFQKLKCSTDWAKNCSLLFMFSWKERLNRKRKWLTNWFVNKQKSRCLIISACGHLIRTAEKSIAPFALLIVMFAKKRKTSSNSTWSFFPVCMSITHLFLSCASTTFLFTCCFILSLKC